MKSSESREDLGSASVESLDDARRRKMLEDLTRDHRAYLEGLARKLCRSQLDPDDLVQDLFEKTLRASAPIPAGANERAWLSRVLHNLFIDKLRRRAARREDPLDEVGAPRRGSGNPRGSGADPLEPPQDERAWWQTLTADEVRATLARLPEEQRMTFELFAFDGRSYDEIAATLGIAKATVGTRILRARQRLRDILTQERGDG